MSLLTVPGSFLQVQALRGCQHMAEMKLRQRNLDLQPAAAEAGGNEVEEASAAAVEAPAAAVEEAVEVEVNSSGPSGLFAQGMNGSWIALSQAPTQKSFTLPDPDEL